MSNRKVLAVAAALGRARAGRLRLERTERAARTPTPTSTRPPRRARGAAGGKAIKIGVLTTCGGPFALFEAEAFSGAKYALVQDAGGKAAGTGPQDQVTRRDDRAAGRSSCTTAARTRRPTRRSRRRGASSRA